MAEPRGREHAARVAVIAWPGADLPALLEANDAVVCCAHVAGGRAAVDAAVREILGRALGDARGGAPGGAPGGRVGDRPDPADDGTRLFLGTFDPLRPNVRTDGHHERQVDHGHSGSPEAHEKHGVRESFGEPREAGDRGEPREQTRVLLDVRSHVTTLFLPEMDIARAPGGKPYLAARDARRPLHFNVAHGGDVLLVALSRTVEVGVDVELVRTVPEWQKIADRMFDAPTHDELRADIARGEPEADAFIRHWCRLEASVKATGAGLFGTEPEPSPHDRAPTRIIDLPDLPLPADATRRYHGALALSP
ncbi:MAG: 4'-phosphopantetheinyl transferase family protein [Gemmatimonadaceae bacterium]